MIYSYNTKEQTVATDSEVTYAVDAIKTGTTVTHAPGTGTFVLNKSGYYYVTVTAVGSASATGTDLVTLTLYNGTNPLPGAIASETSTATTDVVTLVINTIIPVRPSCCAVDNTVNLIVVNTGVEAVYTNTTITITKLS